MSQERGHGAGDGAGENSALLRSLDAAVTAAPEDVTLRLHLARLLLEGGRQTEAISHLGVALQQQPDSAEARTLMAQAVAPPPTRPAEPAEPAASGGADAEPAASGGAGAAEAPGAAEQAADTSDAAEGAGVTERAPDTSDTADGADAADAGDAADGVGEFDWQRAERDLRDTVTPPALPSRPQLADGEEAEPAAEEFWHIELPGTLRLADVGGMQPVKDRLEAAFLAPLRNPQLRRLFAKSLRGGLLLYGPPGCGKTFLARAMAGELGARFLSVSISDVLDMWLGTSERNLREVFLAARRNAPCVLFFDELDALGGKRSHTRHSGMRNVVNQLLTELDGVAGEAANEGVFVLAATNLPWDVDTALLRPGRLDRMVLVTLPDQPAREAILGYHLRDRPVTGIDLQRLARRTDGLSGADLAHLCETAAERALLDSVRSGRPRMIAMRDLLDAAGEVRPTAEEWFTAARTVATFREDGGAYRDLLAYLKRTKRL